MRRRTIVAVGCTAVVVVAAGAALVLRTDLGGSPAPRRSAGSSTLPPRPGVLAALPSAPIPTASAVAAAVRPLLRSTSFGGAAAALVVDAVTGRVLFRGRPTQPAVPASTAKLLTAAAALTTLPPTRTLQTSAWLTGHTVVLVGGGDVTLTRTAAAGYPRTASLTRLAAQAAAALTARSVSRVHVRYDASAWPPAALAAGWSRSYLTEGDVAEPTALELDEARLDTKTLGRSTAPAAQAAAAFAALLRRDGVAVDGRVAAVTKPATAARLATARSASVAALVQRMLTNSDNDLAEALGRTVALAAGEPATFSGEAAAVTRALAALGVPTAGLSLSDASGLSRLDRVTPAALVALLRRAVTDPRLAPVLAGLPVAGATGTLAERYRHGSARAGAGLVRAKTGTLQGVSAEAGVVADAQGRLLAFAFLAGQVPLPTPAEEQLDRLATALARL
jgi:D-alanyl-D-alanine carboxypeptidase/D-alanyl-D-alanine-endopeptidase (penicillin-binding protein 4)